MRSRTVRSLLASVAVLSLFAAQRAHADVDTSGATLPRELEGLSHWLASKDAHCTERCFFLDRMSITGSLATDGNIRFELHGGVLGGSATPIDVPLFGPAAHVRLDDVTEDGQPATIGFDGDHYFLHTASKRFVVKGAIAFSSISTSSGGEMALTVTGPLNTLDVDLKAGRATEGGKLSGLLATTVHFERAIKDTTAPAEVQAPVIEVSRAIRIGHDVAFEYRVSARSGGDLGEVRLPLTLGERVLEVRGARDWRVEEGDKRALVVATPGTAATLAITGTLPQEISGHALVGDGRGAFEWWLVESDAEHRVTVEGDGKQVDVSKTPIAATQPSARLFLLKRGGSMKLDVQTLSSVEALAAVVQSEHRTLIWTRKGDLVADDTLSVDNNGIDYLSLDPQGRAIFIASDGVAERLLRRDASSPELMVPLHNGPHTVHIQSLSQAVPGLFGGKLVLPEIDHALTASRATMMLGMPLGIHAIALTGGDRPHFLFKEEDAVAMGLGLLAVLAIFRGRRDRFLAAVAIVGGWLVAPAIVVSGAVVAGVAALGYALRRRIASISSGTRVVLGGLAAFAVFIAVVVMGSSKAARFDESAHIADGRFASDIPTASASAASSRGAAVGGGKDGDKKEPMKNGSIDNNYKGVAGLAGDLLAGVAPVALPLPGYAHELSISRELVTRERPMRPVLWYVTDALVLPLYAGWAAALAALVWLHRARWVALKDRVKGWASAPVAVKPVVAEKESTPAVAAAQAT